MGMSPSQAAGRHTESYSSSKRKTAERNRQSGAEPKCSGFPEQKNEMGSEIVPSEPLESNRALRPRSHEKPKASQSRENLDKANSTGKRKRKKARRKKGKRIIDDEYSRIRKHLRYLLNRMNYEQSLISAYSGEDWKEPGLEKIKRERELQRATSEILRCKLKIRDIFQRIDLLCAEGRFPQSLFDSEGQISSEDIFCAKCGSKDVTADNDIILCDGACDRAFHQFCLVPPLLKEDIPPDDEGWLCPGCDCKIDCIDLLNDSRGTDLSISDSWEKCFPEVAVGQDGNGLPSCDSDDNDYDRDGPEIDERSQRDDSSSDESDFTSASEDPEASYDDNMGLPSDDSGDRDDDYDPDSLDIDEEVQMESSSDFTAESEDLAAALGNNNELSGEGESSRDSTGRRSSIGGKQSFNSELLFTLDPDLRQDGSAPVSGERNVERLDNKMLNNETYENASSDLSEDDEDYTDADRPSKRRKKSGDDTPVLAKGSSAKNMNQNPKEAMHTSEERTPRTPNIEVTDKSPTKPHKGTSSWSTTGKRVKASFGESITQRLQSAFKGNQYPDRPTKESLAKELGLTFQQVDKWFANARWSFNHSAAMVARTGRSTSEKDDSACGSKREVESEAEKNMDAPANGAVR